MKQDIREQIFSIGSDADFLAAALEVFRYQAKHVSVYRDFIRLLGLSPDDVQSLQQIPFLPVELFKSHPVIAEGIQPEIIFTSSGTTGSATSRHPVADLNLYRESFQKAFRFFYGNPEEYTFLALLPSYLEREGSSLVLMADELIRTSSDSRSGFFLHELEKLSALLQELQAEKKKTILLGVTYALLDLAEQFPQMMPDIIIMETGGMKGKRKEMVREELHGVLTAAFGVSHIHSEYGMTELLSQAYSKGDGKFLCPPWMRVLMRDTNDPMSYVPAGKTGGVNIIDLASLYSCSFIAVSDLGRAGQDGTFEILGRFDASDVRGCNLLVG